MRFLILGLVLSVVAPPAAAQIPPPAAPATQPSNPEAARRFEDLMALIEGPNSAQARRTGVRELLRLGRPETPARLLTLLSGSNKAAKLAVAQTLAESPGDFAPAFLDPLIAALDDPDDELRTTVEAALSASPPAPLLAGLRRLLAAAETSARARLSAVSVLGSMTARDAPALLVELLAHPDGALRHAALAALSRATAIDFRGDIAAALAWWEESRALDLPAWQQLQIERLTRQARQADARLSDLETRLTASLREAYARGNDVERAALLSSYLADTHSAVRALGLELTRTYAQDSRALPAEIAQRVRELLVAPAPRVRVAAIRAVANLRELEDEARLLALLPNERDTGVRAALANGLGYVGGAGALRPLLTLLAEDWAIADEAASAIGRLAERDLLGQAERDEAVAAMLLRFRELTVDQAELRERLLGALARLNTPDCGRTFLTCLDRAEAPAVRLAALRGAARLADPKSVAAPDSQPIGSGRAEPVPRAELVDAIAALSGDADAVVRRGAVEALGTIAFSEAHLQALRTRLNPTSEPEDAIRGLAWRGVLRLLSGRSLAEVDAFAARLPDVPNRRVLATELWLNVEQALVARSAGGAELGEVRARVARERAEAGQIDDAIATYHQALKDLRGAESPSAIRASVELLMLMLQHDRYAPDLAANLLNGSAEHAGRAVWAGLREQLERLIKPETRRDAERMLGHLQKAPPEWLPGEARQELDALLQKTRELGAGRD